ncbi:MAG TPA: UbiA-like polyprenyltransferase [Isosphaeraceae bacterium]|nr:UbiA-like polyprenyltransferase [Isosphaeraceae bacterium]
MLGRLADILGMIKFSHTLFALPFALLGAALAARGPDGWHSSARDWLGILLCMATARSAAMAFNRLADRRIDAANPRTAMRHLPSGRLSTQSVVLFTIICAIGFVASTLLFLPRNPWPLRLSVPVLLWLLGYSYAKRFTSLAHFWLGSALMLAPVAAWVAIRGSVAWPPAWLGLAVLCWVSGFDIIYACQDVDFDRATGLHSLPSRLGVARALRLAAACHAAMIGALVGLGYVYPMGRIYFVGVGVVALLLVYEHALVRPDDLTRVNVAFFQVNIGISVGLMAVGVADLLVK